MNRKSKPFVRLITEFEQTELVGRNAQGITYLMKKGFLVPRTYGCSSDAYTRYTQENSVVLETLREELRSKVDLNARYSVRPSLTLEDDLSSLTPAQFRTYWNVKGVVQILEAIRRVWNSTTGHHIAITSQLEPSRLRDVKMAIIIQQMIDAETSGVVFTKNPMNGRDEVIIEAVPGHIESLSLDQANPTRGVYKWGEWIETPVARAMSLDLLELVAKNAQVLEKWRGAPLMLEWAYDGSALFWLQLREMAASPRRKFYSNKLAKEFLPGLIHPLIWSVNIPIVCGAWARLLSELVGELTINPSDLATQFYYRAYFNMGVIGEVFETLGIPREGLEVLMGHDRNSPEKPSFKPGLKILRHLPRLLQFVLDKAFFGRKMRKFIAANDHALGEICADHLNTMNASDTIRIIEKLYRYNEKAAYFVIVSQLLNAVYNRILMHQLEKQGTTLEEWDLGRAAYRHIDPNWGIEQLYSRYKELPKDTQQTLVSLLEDKDELDENADINCFKRNFADFMVKFGHLSDQGNDFSRVPWREQPELVLNLVVAHRGSQASSTKSGRQNKSRRSSSFLLNWAFQKAKESLEYKEKIGFNYTKSYSLFRNYFLHLAQLLHQEGHLTNSEEIFLFTFNEIKQIVNDGSLSTALSLKRDTRKQRIAEYTNIELPEVIYGDEAPEPRRMDHPGRVLSGLPASSGYYTGLTRVVKGAQDFSRVAEGDILVIPFSDISWTPIFAKAGAVISESGGILSHSAIIAREYGIPSIVGVKGACDLGDDKKVNVDGFSGMITVV